MAYVADGTTVPATSLVRVSAHVALYTAFLWAYPGLVDVAAGRLGGGAGAAAGPLVVAGVLCYPIAVIGSRARRRLSHGPDRREIAGFCLRWAVVFPAGVVLVNLLLVGLLLSPDAASVPLLDPLVPDRGLLLVQGKIAQIVAAALWSGLVGAGASLWGALQPASAA